MVVGLTVSGGAAMGTITAALLHLHGQAVLSLFTSDPAVLGLALSAWPVVALSQPLTTLAFSYDGLLFGANDFRFCALLMVISAHCNDCLRWLLDLLCLALTRRSPGHRLVMSSAPAAFIIWALTPRMGLRGIWAGLACLMTLRALLAAIRISSRSGPWSIYKDPSKGLSERS
eukprot:scaffold170635_cov28-Tisochrysis_lutea.AAC.4